jgi:molybdopterin synthase catalytic subunit
MMITLTRAPISIDSVLDAVRDRGAGAAVVFLGIVRDHARGRAVHHLEYEAYDVLARKELGRIQTEAASRWNVRVAIAHRLGRLEIGEISVAIAVSSAHRAEAFDAGRYLIDTLKQTVPIWKKEVWADGAEWIGRDDPTPASPPPR